MCRLGSPGCSGCVEGIRGLFQQRLLEGSCETSCQVAVITGRAQDEQRSTLLPQDVCGLDCYDGMLEIVGNCCNAIGAVIYILLLLYMFMGVGTVADCFMNV